MEKIYQQHWIDLSVETRQKLVEVFNIPKSGITEVRDQTVISDGHTNDDLNTITVEKMAEYVGSPADLDFAVLWKITLSKIKSELHPPTLEIGTDGVIKDLLQLPYCTTCTSSKGRHKKGCPKFK